MESTKEDIFRLVKKIQEEKIDVQNDQRFVWSVRDNDPILLFEGKTYILKREQDTKMHAEYLEWLKLNG